MSQALCCYAFETLYSKFNRTLPIAIERFNPEPVPSKAPLFITWNKDGNLRGCIGTFLHQKTTEGVAKYALIAALQDSRFPPISKEELNSSLSVLVTLLANFLPAEAWDAWTVGTHGLRLLFEVGGVDYLGTFLPLVAEEENWDKKTTLLYLLRKAGYNGVRESQVVDFYKKGMSEGWMDLTTYEGLKLTLDYDEYVVIRKGIRRGSLDETS